MKTTGAAALGCWLVLCAGCRTVGEPPVGDAGPLPPAFRNVDAATAPAIPPAGEPWWKVFGDPVIDDLQAAASRHAPTLRAALAAYEAAVAARGGDRAAAWPAVDGSFATTLAGESAERSVLAPAGTQQVRERGDSYSLAAKVAYEIDLWGRVRSLIARAEARVDARVADVAAAQLALSVEVAAGYFRLRQAEAELAIVEQEQGQQEQALALRRMRERTGLAAELDVARDEAELSLIRAERVEVRRRRELERNALEALTGRSDISGPPLTQPVPTIPAGIPADAIARRPDVASAEADWRARLAEIGVARAARYPSIQLTAGAGFATDELADLLERPSQFWNVGPALHVPLFDGGRSKAQVEMAEAAARQAEAALRQQVLTALREVEDALVEQQTAAERVQAQSEALQAAAAVHELTELRHRAGFVSYFEVVAAQRARLDLERSLAVATVQRHLAVVRVVGALGGGWSG